MANYSVTYETWSPDDIEAGDTDTRGFDVEREPIEPDSYDIDEAREEGVDPVVYLAVRVLREYYATEASDWPTEGRCWFAATEAEEDYATGDKIYRHVHFDGLTGEQWKQLHAHRPK